MKRNPATRLAIPAMLLVGCSSELEVKPLYNPANGRIVLQTNQDISSKDLFMRARRGNFGSLDCKKMKAEIEQVETTSDARIDGPFVEPTLTTPFYNSGSG